MTHSFLANVIRGVVGRGLTALSALALTMLLPKMMVSDEVGDFYFLFTCSTLFSLIARFGLDYLANSEIANCKIQDESGIKASYVSGLIIMITLFGAVWLILGDDVFGFFGVRVDSAFIGKSVVMGAGLAISFLLFQLYRIDGSIFTGALTRGFFHNLAILAAVVFMVRYTYVDPLNYVPYVVLLVASLNILWYAYNNLSASVFFKNKIKIGSVRFLLYSVLIYLISDVDYYFVKEVLGAGELAVYASIKRLAVMIAIYTDIAHLVLPSYFKKAVFENQLESVTTKFRQMALVGFLGSLVVVIVMWFWGKELIHILWGQEYASGAPALAILLATFCITMSFGFSELWLLLKGDKNILVFGMLNVLLLTVILNYFLVPKYGVYGASLSFFVSNILLRFGLSFKVYRKYKVSLFMGWK